MRHTRFLVLVLLGVVVGLPAAWSAEQHGSYHQNERWGYKIRVPKSWMSPGSAMRSK